MNTGSIDYHTGEPLYTCHTCDLPLHPSNPGVYRKDHHIFCSAGCVYIYYEGEPAAENDDLIP